MVEARSKGNSRYSVIYALALTDASRCNRTNEDNEENREMQFVDTSKLSNSCNISTPKN